MVTRVQAELACLWVLYRLKKLAAAGLVTFVNEHTAITPYGEKRLLEHLKLYQPPARILVEKACDYLFHHDTSPFSKTPAAESARITALILDWQEGAIQ